MASTIFKAKKFLASKFSETQPGRTMIRQLFGTHGDHIMSAMKDIAEIYADQNKAKQLRTDIMKLVLKIVLLYREKIITEEQAEPAKRPLLLMMDLLMDTLEAPQSKRDAQELAQAMKDTHDAVMPLLQPNVREHNWRRLTRVFDFYGSPNFLIPFLAAPEYAASRDTILVNLRILLQPYESKMSETKQFMRAQTLQRRAHVASLVQRPVLLKWLDDDQASSLFSDFLRQNLGPNMNNLLLFLKAENHFRSTNNRNLLQTRSEQVFERYLSPQATAPIEVSAEARQAVQDSLDETQSGAAGVARSMFDPVATEATRLLEDVFTTMFQQSEQFHVLEEELAQCDANLSRHDQMEQILKAEGPEGDIHDIEVDGVGKESLANSEDEFEEGGGGTGGSAALSAEAAEEPDAAAPNPPAEGTGPASSTLSPTEAASDAQPPAPPS